ncbi:MAG: hypothetical protein DRP11_01995 [Candidatus Aenigmatarchaeota archaeon]|nr:MAG: hypothetical protein DRP11_01995 [Candidatus Aenigmarchaeota archaeon]
MENPALTLSLFYIKKYREKGLLDVAVKCNYFPPIKVSEFPKNLKKYLETPLVYVLNRELVYPQFEIKKCIRDIVGAEK